MSLKDQMTTEDKEFQKWVQTSEPTGLAQHVAGFRISYAMIEAIQKSAFKAGWNAKENQNNQPTP